MATIQDGSKEELELFKAVRLIRSALNLPNEATDTVLVLIDTTEKLQALKDWVESKTQNGELMSNEDELLNVVSKIHREK